ncbi:bifunctional homocysteine S-methyltransferase/5,10-methylenetetrahydrofolate reductase [Gottschalkia purinilytica]|uniref:Bifunctional homocysteine S-methyltransferase/5,10-methylenetetrahydrofolate reductase n=1 Tax=Gottschalkia purinilytica TaxID=1503 RepID=A0A0L0WBY8_GOTPU|nr:bifunctional homocysteine S-methyltransferase/methylenetetrahydrofolate reductase [Gottschalkia purinilytica]KNF08979.1 bifunctional homocysteine S-methyltransferase/5,10-methylenetetrahydrofolate reductase [Gottschalkia purinilytica]
MLQEYLKENILITDGAMGTYYSEITGDKVSFCEFANINKPQVIRDIHVDYIKSGAKLIRTNTFSANTISLGVTREKVKEIIEKGYTIAKKATEGTDVFIGASIGPIHESRFKKEDDIDILDEYKFIIDTFMELGENIFVFETFGTIDYLKEISEYIKSKNSDAFILTQFAVTLDGFTRKGISIKSIIDELKLIKSIDAYGFNCGSGPTHLYRLLKNMDIFSDTISALPNAGYPEIINERMVYVNNPEYFGDIVVDISKLGAKIIGGCCGTTPNHIKSLVERLKIKTTDENIHVETKRTKLISENKKENNFVDKIEKQDFIIAVELDPPFDTSIERMIENARTCKEHGVDIVTIADSPRAIARVDSIMIAAKIKREVGIDVMPHVCCRDKNLNALKSGLLAAHIEDIRNMLVITGDPILDIDKISTKSVFNLNSYRLIELISEMNKEIFKSDKINISGAVNLNVPNKEAEINRMLKKVDKGANTFFTQPIFSDETVEFLAKTREKYKVKILGGIMPIVTYKNAQFLNNEVPGIHIPEEYVNRFHKNMTREEGEKVGIEIAIEIANKIKQHVDGLYFITPFDRIEMIVEILNRINYK